MLSPVKKLTSAKGNACKICIARRYFLFGFQIVVLALSVTMHSASLLAQGTSPDGKVEKLQPGQMPYFDAVPDRIEGFNRCSWAVNNWLFRGIIYPLSFVYNTVAPKPVRTGIGNAGHNLIYPVRLFNNCCQAKWGGAWEETKRFGANSTVGLGGFFDPATKWKIGRSDEDFGQTLGHYGYKPGFYLEVPIIGPSNGRDAVGRIVDLPLDILFWVGVAYPNEFWPDTTRPGAEANNLSGNARNYKRQLDSLVDPYQAQRTLYSLNRQRLILDYEPVSGTNKKTGLFLLDAEKGGSAGMLYPWPGFLPAGPLHGGIRGHDVPARLLGGGLLRSVPEGVHGVCLNHGASGLRPGRLR